MRMCCLVTRLDNLPFFQLSGWTSNLIDMIMDHHFSTVRTEKETAFEAAATSTHFEPPASVYLCAFAG